MNLIESYKNRLAIAESVHQKSHNGAKMSAQKKLMIASVLHNTSRFLNEASGAAEKDIIKAKLDLAKAQEAEIKTTLESAKARLAQLKADGAWKRFWRERNKG